MGSEPAYKLDEMPCGGTPIYDASSGIGYFCDTCYAVIGSIGQPRRCVELNGRTAKEVPNNKLGSQ